MIGASLLGKMAGSPGTLALLGCPAAIKLVAAGISAAIAGLKVRKTEERIEQYDSMTMGSAGKRRPGNELNDEVVALQDETTVLHGETLGTADGVFVVFSVSMGVCCLIASPYCSGLPMANSRLVKALP